MLDRRIVSALLFCAPFLSSAQEPPASGCAQIARRFAHARHFDSVDVLLEVEPGAPNGPRFILTNMNQEPLTAFVVEVEGVGKTPPSLMLSDAWIGMNIISPIPRGLSVVMGIPREVGKAVPNVRVVAAVWEDGSTFGPDEQLKRIAANRAATATAYSGAIAILQEGMQKKWTSEQYLAAIEAAEKAAPVEPATSESVAVNRKSFETIRRNLPAVTSERTAKALRDDFTRRLGLLQGERCDKH